MNKSKNDVFIGCVAIAVIVGLSALAGGLKVLAYTGWALGAGILILFLLQLKRKDATMVAVMLMPIIMLRKFFMPKKVREKLRRIQNGNEPERK
ncbi:hypothetical protein O0882_11570 [Janthinobacterium sp. SUN073]|uniref:hypothetical protein n=1 Tax=Janthinobacterium sp. SUN073 TaxID=3004102 RepID=UPI0025AFEFFB|nr:hypothetical protein [Janthinobacterium sp. SUN073]MDN2696958.1 hypothetical protein [Janthinobacterium sp. SUN073]